MKDAEMYVRLAFEALKKSGFDNAHALEHLQGIVMQVWMHACGLVTQMLMHFM